MKCNYVFVYGSLKRGFGNNRLLQNDESEFICEDYIEDFEMYSMGAFPGVVHVPGSRSVVHGEVWKVSDNILERLNTLEGFRGEDNPSNFYNCKKVETKNYHHSCYVYLQDTAPSDMLVLEGIWENPYVTSRTTS